MLLRVLTQKSSFSSALFCCSCLNDECLADCNDYKCCMAQIFCENMVSGGTYLFMPLPEQQDWVSQNKQIYE